MMSLDRLADKLSRSVQGTEALDNRKRAIRAYEALVTFAGPEKDEPVEDLLTDLLSNILHLADVVAPEVSFPEVWQKAERHHYAEVTGRPHPWEPMDVTFDDMDPNMTACPECESKEGTNPECELCHGTGMVSLNTAHDWDDEQEEQQPDPYRCPECDTYSGRFTAFTDDEGDTWVTHSTCGREGIEASYIRGTQEYEDAFNEGGE